MFVISISKCNIFFHIVVKGHMHKYSPQDKSLEGNGFVGESDASSEAVCKTIRRLAGLPGELRGQAFRRTSLR